MSDKEQKQRRRRREEARPRASVEDVSGDSEPAEYPDHRRWSVLSSTADQDSPRSTRANFGSPSARREHRDDSSSRASMKPESDNPAKGNYYPANSAGTQKPQQYTIGGERSRQDSALAGKYDPKGVHAWAKWTSTRGSEYVGGQSAQIQAPQSQNTGYGSGWTRTPQRNDTQDSRSQDWYGRAPALPLQTQDPFAGGQTKGNQPENRRYEAVKRARGPSPIDQSLRYDAYSTVQSQRLSSPSPGYAGGRRETEDNFRATETRRLEAPRTQRSEAVSAQGYGARYPPNNDGRRYNPPSEVPRGSRDDPRYGRSGQYGPSDTGSPVRRGSDERSGARRRDPERDRRRSDDQDNRRRDPRAEPRDRKGRSSDQAPSSSRSKPSDSGRPVMPYPAPYDPQASQYGQSPSVESSGRYSQQSWNATLPERPAKESRTVSFGGESRVDNESLRSGSTIRPEQSRRRSDETDKQYMAFVTRPSEASSQRLAQLEDWTDQTKSLKDPLSDKLEGDLDSALARSLRDDRRLWEEDYRLDPKDVVREYKDSRKRTARRFRDFYPSRVETLYNIHRNDPSKTLPSYNTTVYGDIEIKTLPRSIKITPTYEVTVGGMEPEKKTGPSVTYDKVGAGRKFLQDLTR